MRPIILKSIAPNLNPGTKANPERFGDVVRVRFPNSYRPCNFHCPYCVADLLHADERDRWEFRDQHRKILENLVASPYRFIVRMGPAGEFFLSKPLIEDARWLSNQPNIEAVNLITNLGLPIEVYLRAFEGYERKKIGLTASFHPTEVKDVDAWMARVERLKSVVEMSLVIVAYPPLVFTLPDIHRKLSRLGVPIGVNGFIGNLQGKEYPAGYTALERQCLKEISFSRHEFEYWINGRRPGLCNAGYKSIYIQIDDGSVFSCGMVNRFHLGELLTGPNFRLMDSPSPCMNDSCLCESENLNPVVFDQYYEWTGIGWRNYRYRFDDLAKENPQFSEWNIEYW